ncbi:MAG: 30S ribosomal protein S6 [bacterium]|nr:30S ribosomal protein S6 [bacterium]
MKEYEGMFILRADLPEEQVGKAAEEIAAELEKAGATIEEKTLGSKQRLSYTVGRQHDGCPLCVRFRAKPAVLEGLTRQFGKNQNVLRHMFVRGGERPPAEGAGAQAAGHERR